MAGLRSAVCNPYVDASAFTEDSACTGDLVTEGSETVWNRGHYGPSLLWYNPEPSSTPGKPFTWRYAMRFIASTGGNDSLGLGSPPTPHFESSRYRKINLHNVWYRGVIEFRWFVWSGTRSSGKIKSIHGTIQGARCQITVFHPWLDAIAARTRRPILSTPLVAARVTISVSFPANPSP